MKRTHYANGDEINLACGCPDAWRDYPAECRECGCDFFREEPRQVICPDCSNPIDLDEETDD